MAPSKRLFISFDYDNDRSYRNLLSALKANRDSAIDFEDLTPQEIQSNDVSRIKAVLTSRIGRSTHTLVVVGAHANTRHPKHIQIGSRNWQWWEIEQTRELKPSPGFIGVKIAPSYHSPEPLLGASAVWAYTYSVDSILKAINSA